MSDYLWDKTGEPEEDVEQLENLLGTLRYQPRPLEIPATAMPTAARPRAFTTIFSRPRIALAASLLLTLLAGMWFVTRQDEQQKEPLAKVEQGTTTTSGSRQTETAVVPNAATDSNASTGSAVGNASIDNAVEPAPRQKKAVVVATPKTQRAPRQFVAKRQKRQPRVEETMPAPLEEVAVGGGMRWQVEQPMTAQQREATEQLMLALRLASAKFNYAQREMQEIGRAGK
ncbi:MAG TPA: hypothetical protein VK363_11045 [Pyrinomonadaceae bacterium]|nr:hypothetical protein [Pyrinomonadaceae bacterium]